MPPHLRLAYNAETPDARPDIPAEYPLSREEIMSDLAEGGTAALDAHISRALNAEANARAMKEQAKALTERAAALEANAAVVRETITQYLEATDQSAVETLRHKVSLQVAGGKPRVILSVPADQLPEEYRKVSYAEDKDAIRRVLEAGSPLPFASLEPKRFSLRIKAKN